MAPADLTRLAKARGQRSQLATQRNALHVELAAAEARAAQLERTRGSETARRAATKAIDRAHDRLQALDGKGAQLDASIDVLRDRLRDAEPERAVEHLDGGVPVTLLPLRLETRFGDGNQSLRIRIFPEQVHIDAHEPELTADELVAATAYWQARWAAGSDVEARRAAWARLARQVRPTRARWLVEATTPTNLDQLGQGQPVFPDIAQRPGPWTRAPVARLLPEQWVAIGYRNGAEVFRRWSAPVAEQVAVGLTPEQGATAEASPPTAEQETLPIDDGLRWLVDYDKALGLGMAVTVTDADLGQGKLADGLDELVVVGVDWTLTPADAAIALADQLARHAVSDGLALLAAGTPTNNTDDDRAAAGTDPRLDIGALDPAEPNQIAQMSGARVAGALGLPAGGALEDVPSFGHFDDGAASDMNTVLWAPTVGYFLDQMLRPLVSSATADRARSHFAANVRGRGPFDCLRVGHQPYGVLPVLAGPLVSNNAFESGLARHLDGLRPFWNSNAGRVPQLGGSDRPDADLVDLLRRTPRSVSFRFRQAMGSAFTRNIVDFARVATFQDQFAGVMLQLAGLSARPELAGVTVSPNHRGVPVKLVAPGELSETEPLQPNYIDAVRAETTRLGVLVRLLADPAAADSLLEALLRQAAMLELAIGATRLVVTQEIATGALTRRPPIETVFDREVIGIDDGGLDDDSVSVLGKVAGPIDLAKLNLPPVSGQLSLADFLATRRDIELLRRPETQRFGEFRAALQRLARIPAAELARLTADTLDCASHRLDAWITSLATRRLAAVRKEGTGCHIGAFGYVEKLAPRAVPASQGYLQAPSVAHATTAAVLRSAHLARRDDDGGILALDLSSTRVALGLELIEGVQQGQPIGVLLGYRFERGLRDQRMTLAKYILPLRQAAPLAAAAAGPDDGTPVETIAARDVVDGILLLQRWKAGRDALYDSLPIAVPATDRNDIDLELARIDDALDAVSDLLVAESVHQAVLGNSARSAAALDALDRQTTIPDIAFARTPRSGAGASHRLLVLFPATAPADGWAALVDARAVRPSQRVDAWVGAVLGRPERFRFGADVHDSDGNVVQQLEADLPQLGLSALASASACVAAGAGGTTELEERLALVFGALVSAPDAARLVLLDDPPAGSSPTTLGLRELLELGAQVMDMASGARPADARSLSPDSERVDAGIAVAELQVRADHAVSTLQTAVDALAAAAGAAVDVVTERLLQLVSAGRRNAVPSASSMAGADALAAHVATELSTARALLSQLAADEAAFDRGAADPAAQAAHDLTRLRRVFGEGFPVAPVFTTQFGTDLNASAADGALAGDDPLAPATWLAQHALVRTGAGRLAGVLMASEVLVGAVGLEALTVAQLPYAAGDRWLGSRREPGEERPVATVSIVAHAATGIDFTAPLAGLVLDQWSDVIPNDHETTGVSFHFDAPGARAPQTLLVAVPGDTTAASWTVELLAGAVREAVALARIRALDLDDLEGVGRFLPMIYLPFNIESTTPSTNLSGLIAKAITADNLAFEQHRDDITGQVP